MVMSTNALDDNNRSEGKDNDSNYPNKVLHKSEGNQSRKEILKALGSMGVEIDNFDSLSIEELHALLINVQNLIQANHPVKGPRKFNTGLHTPILSEADRKILRSLLLSDGSVSSLTLSRELDIPLSTIQRRRKRLEADLVERNYSLKGERFGWRMATLLISVANGNASGVGSEIMEVTDAVALVTRTLGENCIDLKVDLIFKTNHDLLSLIDRVKSINGVRNVTWTESVEVLGRSRRCYREMIDSNP